MLIENGVLVADTLRSLADNEIDSDYFAICHTNENGTEIECELAITGYARQAAGTVDDLVNALEVAEKRIAELEAEPVSQTYKLPLKVNNNPRTRGDFFYLNSLRRVLFYGDDKCTPESQVNGMENHSTELSKQRTSTTAMTTG